MNIGTVVEGATDRLVIEEILRHLLADVHELRFLPLQPLPTFGETGAGWKGVRRWCQQVSEEASLEMLLSNETGPELDVLVIHVDADIVVEQDLQEGLAETITGLPLPCPPAADNARAIRQLFHGWLRREDLPGKIVFAIPSQDMENWTFAALFPTDPLCERADYECIQQGPNRNNHPSYRLTLQDYAWPGCGKILKRKGPEIKKPENRYRLIVGQVSEQWETVCRICSQAAAFQRAVQERNQE